MLEVISSLHWDIIIKIIGIDLMLGGDNAIIIAMACAGLAAGVRTKAVILGTLGAVLIRAILLAGAGEIFNTYEWLKIIAGLWLLVIGVQLLLQEDNHNVAQSDNLWGAIKTIVVADLIMSIDNVVAVTSAAAPAGEHAIAYAIFGIALSIPIIVFASNILLGLLGKYPIITWAGAALLGWVGIETVLQVSYVGEMFHAHGVSHHLATAAGGALVVAIASLIRNRKTPEGITQ